MSDMVAIASERARHRRTSRSPTSSTNPLRGASIRSRPPTPYDVPRSHVRSHRRRSTVRLTSRRAVAAAACCRPRSTSSSTTVSITRRPVDPIGTFSDSHYYRSSVCLFGHLIALALWTGWSRCRSATFGNVRPVVLPSDCRVARGRVRLGARNWKPLFIDNGKWTMRVSRFEPPTRAVVSGVGESIARRARRTRGERCFAGGRRYRRESSVR